MEACTAVYAEFRCLSAGLFVFVESCAAFNTEFNIILHLGLTIWTNHKKIPLFEKVFCLFYKMYNRSKYYIFLSILLQEKAKTNIIY